MGIRSEIKETKAVQIGDKRIIQRARSTVYTNDIMDVVWNRPHSVLVEEDGVVQTLPIVDVTKTLQFLLWGLTAGFSLLSFQRFIRHRKKVKNGRKK